MKARNIKTLILYIVTLWMEICSMGIINKDMGLFLVLDVDRSSSATEHTKMVSQSAITVSGDYVFLSVERWEKSGTLGMLHYENDQTQGCYRINWKTGEATRLSGDIYTGLFVFHEDYLIGCDAKRNTVWLDHDFRVLEKIH